VQEVTWEVQEAMKHRHPSPLSCPGVRHDACTTGVHILIFWTPTPTRCPYDRCPHSNILDTDTDTMPVRQVSVFVSCPVSVLMLMLYRQEAKVLSVLFVLSHEPVYHDNILAEAC